MLPLSSVWLLSDIAEAKGKQELFTRQTPQVLEALRQMALIQSVESSNRIEGVVVEPGRLHPLVIGDATPRDRSEEEIRNYRDALELIHSRCRDLEVTPGLLRRLHGIVQKGSGDAGQWKAADNEIIEMREDGLPRIRFRPVSAAQTPASVQELCDTYKRTLDRETIPPLLAVAGLVLDFLCIHPFRDGNGRVSRLLTLLGLYHHGYEVGRYISLERLVEESRNEYYEVLKNSSDGWHEGRHDLLPWLNFFLAVIRRAYRVFQERAEDLKGTRGTKTAQIMASIYDFNSDFSLSELMEACPEISRDMARRVLWDLQKEGKVESLGRGPGARWRKLAPKA